MNHEPETHDYLTRTEWAVMPHRSAMSGVLRTLLVVALAAAAGFGVRYYDLNIGDPRELEQLRTSWQQQTRSVESLSEAVAGAKVEVEIERATRAELERQLAEVTEQLKQAQEELEFLKSARSGDNAAPAR